MLLLAMLAKYLDIWMSFGKHRLIRTYISVQGSFVQPESPHVASKRVVKGSGLLGPVHDHFTGFPVWQRASPQNGTVIFLYLGWLNEKVKDAWEKSA